MLTSYSDRCIAVVQNHDYYCSGASGTTPVSTFGPVTWPAAELSPLLSLSSANFVGALVPLDLVGSIAEREEVLRHSLFYLHWACF